MSAPRALIAAAICLGLLVPAVAAPGKPTMTITGTVKAAEVYSGKTIAVYIDDPQEGKFLAVRSTDVGKELLSLVGQRVRVTGYIKKPRPGTEARFKIIIDVLTYEVEPPEDA